MTELKKINTDENKLHYQREVMELFSINLKYPAIINTIFQDISKERKITLIGNNSIKLALLAIDELVAKLKEKETKQLIWLTDKKPLQIAKIKSRLKEFEELAAIQKRQLVDDLNSVDEFDTFFQEAKDKFSNYNYKHLPKKWAESGFKSYVALSNKIEELEEKLFDLENMGNYYSLNSKGLVKDLGVSYVSDLKQIQDLLSKAALTPISAQQLSNMIIKPAEEMFDPFADEED